MAGVRGNALMEELVIYTLVVSPIGALTVARNEGGSVTAVRFNGEAPEPDWRRDDAPFERVRQQLEAYFAGDLQQFDLTLDPAGTPFQRRVWEALRRIPYGQTRTYAEIAREIGSPTAFRAVGAANGANPIPVIIPCHRVIGSDGSLTGFGGGIETKKRLLALESMNASPLFARRSQ
jgi:methylated-DNA-[protein]-cysteine S-methyltransferase